MPLGSDAEIIIGANLGSADRAVDAFFQRLNQKSRVGGINAQAFTGPLGKISGKANEFQKSLAAAEARVLAFGATAGVLYSLGRAFSELVLSTIKVEKALVDINVLLKASTSDLSKFSTDLFKIANDTSTSFDDTAKAAQEFARQGVGAEETLRRTNAAMQLVKISGLDMAKAVSSITAVLEGFSNEALTAEDIINRLAAVDTKFAVSAGGLADALVRVGSVAADANIDLSKTIALITAIKQTTGRSEAVIGNSLKTILTKVQSPDTLANLEAIGVATKNLAGESLNSIDVLKNLAGVYENLSSAQKYFISTNIANLYQINSLKAIFKDLGSSTSNYQDALNAAGDSTGYAQARIKELNKTLSAQIQILKNDFTKAFANIGSIVIKPTLSGGIGGISEILKTVGNIGTEDAGVGVKSWEIALTRI